MKFYKFELHEYMDMFPTIKVVAFNSIEDANNWAKEMTLIYSGGPTTLKEEMSNASARAYIKSLYEHEINHRQDDSREFILNAEKLYAQCYPNNEPIFTTDEIARL